MRGSGEHGSQHGNAGNEMLSSACAHSSTAATEACIQSAGGNGWLQTQLQTSSAAEGMPASEAHVHAQGSGSSQARTATQLSAAQLATNRASSTDAARHGSQPADGPATPARIDHAAGLDGATATQVLTQASGSGAPGLQQTTQLSPADAAMLAAGWTSDDDLGADAASPPPIAPSAIGGSAAKVCAQADATDSAAPLAAAPGQLSAADAAMLAAGWSTEEDQESNVQPPTLVQPQAVDPLASQAHIQQSAAHGSGIGAGSAQANVGGGSAAQQGAQLSAADAAMLAAGWISDDDAGQRAASAAGDVHASIVGSQPAAPPATPARLTQHHDATLAGALQPCVNGVAASQPQASTLLSPADLAMLAAGWSTEEDEQPSEQQTASQPAAAPATPARCPPDVSDADVTPLQAHQLSSVQASPAAAAATSSPQTPATLQQGTVSSSPIACASTPETQSVQSVFRSPAAATGSPVPRDALTAACCQWLEVDLQRFGAVANATGLLKGVPDNEVAWQTGLLVVGVVQEALAAATQGCLVPMMQQAVLLPSGVLFAVWVAGNGKFWHSANGVGKDAPADLKGEVASTGSKWNSVLSSSGVAARLRSVPVHRALKMVTNGYGAAFQHVLQAPAR